MPRVVYDPANFCIYCGVETYARDSNRHLAEEHIIPLGLNGTETLPRASCRKCERITGNFESKVLRGALLGCRTILGLATRSPKDRPKSLPLFCSTTGIERKVMIPIEDYPVNLLLLRMSKPGVFRSGLEGAPSCFPWHHFFNDKTDVLRRHYGINRFATSSLDAYSYVRMIAKMAHSFAVANMGHGGFTPVLGPLILEDGDPELNARNLLQFVGGIEEIEPPDDLLHWIQFEDPTPETLPFVVVRLRLFAMLGSPTYRVVVGRRLRIEDPRQ